MANGGINADGTAYLDGAARGELLLQRCEACGHVQFPPKAICETCWQEAPRSFSASGRGRVESLTIVRRAPLPTFRDKVPYVVAAIRVDEGPRMITNLVGEGALEARIGDAVEVTFEAVPSGETLPQFRRSTAP